MLWLWWLSRWDSLLMISFFYMFIYYIISFFNRLRKKITGSQSSFRSLTGWPIHAMYCMLLALSKATSCSPWWLSTIEPTLYIYCGLFFVIITSSFHLVPTCAKNVTYHSDLNLLYLDLVSYSGRFIFL